MLHDELYNIMKRNRKLVRPNCRVREVVKAGDGSKTIVLDDRI